VHRVSGLDGTFVGRRRVRAFGFRRRNGTEREPPRFVHEYRVTTRRKPTRRFPFGIRHYSFTRVNYIFRRRAPIRQNLFRRRCLQVTPVFATRVVRLLCNTAVKVFDIRYARAGPRHRVKSFFDVPIALQSAVIRNLLPLARVRMYTRNTTEFEIPSHTSAIYSTSAGMNDV